MNKNKKIYAMKTLKILLAVMISIITIISFSSCEKDEPAELKGIELLYGDTLETNAQATNKWYAYELMVPINDTIWPPGPDGEPVKERDPNTGEWNIVGIQTTEVTVEQQLNKVSFKAMELLAQERNRTTEFFNANPNEKIYVTFPKDSRITSRITENGKIFEDEMNELNNIRERLVNNPTHTLSQEIEIIHTAAQLTWVAACKEDFIDQVLNPDK